MEWSSVILFIIALSIVLFWIFRSKFANFPPGPVGLPIVGYLPFLGKYPYRSFVKLGEKYGNVFSVKLGTTPVVLLNDWPAVKAALVDQADIFNGRPRNDVYKEIFWDSDISFADGPGWKERRRLTLHHLKSVGFGSVTLEDRIVDEIQKIITKLKEGYPDEMVIEVNDYFFISFLNVIWSFVGGMYFKDDDIEDHKFIQNLTLTFREISNTNPAMFVPGFKYVFPTEYQKVMDTIKSIPMFISKTVDQHIATFQEEHVRDFIDGCLKEMNCSGGSPKRRSTPITKNNVVQIAHDLFLAGVETSNLTLLWGLLYLSTWPTIQRKVQLELDEVIGRDRMPNFKDRLQLKYTNAVIMEIHRFSSIVPLSLPHTATKDTQVFGYRLPKDTIVLPNLWAVHNDPKYWTDPRVFRPERFLNENGEIQKPEYLVPFSVGGRSCLGESLAHMNSFLFLVCLLHQFSFSLVPGMEPPSFDPVYALSIGPQPFSLVVKQR